MKKKKLLISVISCTAAIAILVGVWAATRTDSAYVPTTVEQLQQVAKNYSSAIDKSDGLKQSDGYFQYLNQLGDRTKAADTLLLTGEKVAEKDDSVSVADVNGKENVLITGADGYVEWAFTVEKAGLYALWMTYCPQKGTGSSIERQILLDGEIPYSELNNILLNRTYAPETVDFEQDQRGDDVRPDMLETEVWRTVPVMDSLRYYSDPLEIYLTEGEHTLRLVSVKEPMALAGIELRAPETTMSYEEYLETYASAAGTGTKSGEAEAEKVLTVSAPSIYPVSDRTSTYTSPHHVSKLRLNAIGGGQWKTAGQEIQLTIHVETAGLYHLAFRYKQEGMVGGFVSRALKINGEYPFEEAKSLRFSYTDDWVTKMVGPDDDPYLFYLKEGDNVLTMEVVLGSLAEVTRIMQDSIYTLNTIYRNILTLTGPKPDIYRDYNFDVLLDTSIEEMKQQIGIIGAASDTLATLTGGKGQVTAPLDKIIFDLEEMSGDPRKIAKQFSMFETDIASLGTWMTSIQEQPLLLDKIYALSSEAPLPKNSHNVFVNLGYGIQSIVASFTEDYSMMGTTYDPEQALDIWVTTGRDQSLVIKRMIDRYFCEETGTGVNLKLVTANTLLPSVLSGVGPDVSLLNTQDIAVDFALRGASMELNGFDTFGDVMARFKPSAYESLTFKDKVYGLPETQTFYMFFYRKDIFQQYDLTPPKTFHDLIVLIPELQKRNMQIGFPVGMVGYSTLMYQLSEPLYVNDGEHSNINSDKSIEAFSTLTELFTDYKFPVNYNFATRFRSGEMPCAIMSYADTYNQLTLFAPEIKGLWDFVPLPGLEAEGEANNMSFSTVTSAMIMSNTTKAQSAWDFLDWWTRTDTQVRYANEMEVLIGVGAKQTVANVEALSSLSWSRAELENIYDQWDKTFSLPSVPGSYYYTRVVDFAFNRVYNTNADPVETLQSYQKSLEEELARKREEFGLNVS